MTRDGAAIAPLSDTKNPLRPMTFQNGQGQTSMLHAGDVHFPMKAFEPGAVVTISAVPRQGEPMTLTLDDGKLRELR